MDRDDPFAQLPTRHRVLLLLSCPRCCREVRERIPGSHRKCIETAFARLKADRLIEPVTSCHQSRLYRRSSLGNLLAKELTGDAPECPHDLTQEELELRSWICAGRYRRLVLRAISQPMTAKQIRKIILPHFEQIGANHVHRTLRAFRVRAIVVPHDVGWELTSSGSLQRDVELHELDQHWEAPTGWGRLASRR